MNSRAQEPQQEEALPIFLLIENSAKDYSLMEKTLRKVGLHWRFIVVKDGATAIEHMARKGFPTLLVTRLTTPKIDAMDVIEWVRAMHLPVPLPIAIYDEFMPPDARQQLEKFEVTDFIGKHVSPQNLQSRLAELLHRAEQAMLKRRSPSRNSQATLN